MENCTNHITLEEMDLSVRSYNLLKRAGFNTVGDVNFMTDKQLLKIKKLGKKSLEDIKQKIFNEKGLTEISETDLSDTADHDRINYNMGLSVRTVNALIRAEITTFTKLRQVTDYNLKLIRNIGKNAIAEINAAVPDRIRTYNGEAEELEAYRVAYKLDRDTRHILRRMEAENMKLSELMKSDLQVSYKRQARKLIIAFCDVFPERIPDVISVFDAVGDTGDRLYKTLKQAVNGGTRQQY